MKKIKLLLSTLLALTVLCGVGCTHIHDDQCGYNPKTGEGCTHICDDDFIIVFDQDRGLGS